MKKSLSLFFLTLLILLGAYFRASGLFHGLDEGVIFHPDTPKQMLNLSRGLDGIYIWYLDSLFYDGYPYGLNRLDEFLLRGISLPVHLTQSLLHGDAAPRWDPAASNLYAVARVLRGFYGMMALIFVTASAWLFTRNRWAVLATCAFAAVAPLASTVTHSASGDVGLDLFLSATLLCLALHSRTPRPRWLLAAGFTVGMAFAAKYQGALGAWMVGIYLLLKTLQSRGSWGSFLRCGLQASAACFAGVLVLTPALLLDPKTTWRLMGENVVFIKNYKVPAEFLELPVWTRVLTGLQRNVPPMVEALGPFLLFAALLSLGFALRSWMRLYKSREAEGGGFSAPFTALWVACASFPFGVLLISTAMKPVVQPFHFSFLVYPLSLSAGLLLHAMRPLRPGKSAWPLWAAGLLIFANGLRVSLQEDFYWRSPSLMSVSNRYVRESTASPLHQSWEFGRPDEVKRFFLHEYGLSVFRNRRRTVSAPDAAWWRAHGQLPVPTLPLFDEIPGWIFINGARFPRSDRAFCLPAGEGGTTRLVFEGEVPPRLHLGLRSGQNPSFLKGSLRGHHFSEFIPPHSQRVIEVPFSGADRRNRAYEDSPPTYVLNLNLQSTLADLWVEVITEEAQRRTFEAFGPEASPSESGLEEEARRILSTIQYLGEDEAQSLPPAPHRLGGGTLALPAGSYELVLDLVNPHAGATPLRMVWRDPAGLQADLLSASFDSEPGTHQHRFTIHKPFAPFEVEAVLEPLDPGLILRRWSLRPAGHQRIPEAPPLPSPDWFPLEIRYDHGIVLKGFHVSFSESAPQRIELAVLAELPERLPRRVFEETFFFVHLLGPDGAMLQAFDIPFETLSFSAENVRRHVYELEPTHTEWSSITLRFGLYTPRSRIRFRPRIVSPLDLRERERRRAIDLHTFPAPFRGQTLFMPGDEP